jgi:Protein of unknown function (DUF4019)
MPDRMQRQACFHALVSDWYRVLHRLRKHMNRFVCCVCILAPLQGLSPVSAADESTDAAARAAQSWLALVDAEKYVESWNEAAQVLKKQVTREEWLKRLNSFRLPLGKMASRTLKSSVSYMKFVPGNPDAQYVIIRYDTKFEGNKASVETVSPTKEKDGQWRISGYFIE